MPCPEAAHSRRRAHGLDIGSYNRAAKSVRRLFLPSARLASYNGKQTGRTHVPAGLFSSFHPGKPGAQLSSSSFTLAKTIRPAAV